MARKNFWKLNARVFLLYADLTFNHKQWSQIEIYSSQDFDTVALLAARCPNVMEATWDVRRIGGRGASHLQLLGGLPALERLTIQGAMLSVPVDSLSGLIRLRSLKFLSCRDSDESGALLESALVLSALTVLELSSCRRVTGAGFSRLTALTALAALIMNDTFGFTTAGMRQLSSLTALSELEMSYSSPPPDAGPFDLAALRGLKSLHRLVLRGTYCLLPRADAPLRLPALHTLNVVGSNMTDWGSLLGLLPAERCGLTDMAMTLHAKLIDSLQLFQVPPLLGLTKLMLQSPARQFPVVELSACLSGIPALHKLVLDEFWWVTDDDVADFTRLPALQALSFCRCVRITPAVANRFTDLLITITFGD